MLLPVLGGTVPKGTVPCSGFGGGFWSIRDSRRLCPEIVDNFVEDVDKNLAYTYSQVSMFIAS